MIFIQKYLYKSSAGYNFAQHSTAQHSTAQHSTYNMATPIRAYYNSFFNNKQTSYGNFSMVGLLFYFLYQKQFKNYLVCLFLI